MQESDLLIWKLQTLIQVLGHKDYAPGVTTASEHVTHEVQSLLDQHNALYGTQYAIPVNPLTPAA